MYTGLWTSTGMPHIKEEVGVAGGFFICSFCFLPVSSLLVWLIDFSSRFPCCAITAPNGVLPAGTRICKTDVGWIGAGYK